MAQGQQGQGGIAMGGVIIEPALADLHSRRLRDFERAVRAERVKDMHVITPGDRLEAARQVSFFVQGGDDHRDHEMQTLPQRLYQSWPCRIIERASHGTRPTRARAFTRNPSSRNNCERVASENSLTCP